MLLLTLGACGDWLDINENPNYPSELSAPQSVMPTAQLAIVNACMGWETGFDGGFYSQYWTQDFTSSQFKSVDQYEEQSYSYAYDNLVSSALIDLKSITSSTEEGDAWYMIAEVLSIYAWQIVTDTWGDIPYSEALQGDEYLFAPKFDTQESIYTDLLSRIDKIVAADYTDAIIDGTKYDFIFDGDLTQWTKFANSLKVKLMIRLSETANYDNAAILTFIEGHDLLSETALLGGALWEDRDEKRHPMVEFQTAGYFGNVIASRTFISYLTENNDPRTDSYYIAPSGGHQGAFQGDFASKADSDGDGTSDDKEEYSTVEFSETANIPLISMWEQDFYVAEVYARAGDFTNAKTYYDAAVNASLAYWGVDTTITATGEYAEFVATETEAAIEQIAMQKWVSYCKLQHNEAFLERNRLKYPGVDKVNVDLNRSTVNENFPVGSFTLSIAGRALLNDNLPASAIYPTSITARNENANSQKVNMGENVWWNQKAENVKN